MRINESEEKKLKLVSGAVSSARIGVRCRKETLSSLSMGNEPEEPEQEEGEDRTFGVDPELFMNKKERMLWNRISEQKKRYYIRKGMEAAKRMPEGKGRKSGTWERKVRETFQREERLYNQEALPAFLNRSRQRKARGKTGRSGTGKGGRSAAAQQKFYEKSSGRETFYVSGEGTAKGNVHEPEESSNVNEKSAAEFWTPGQKEEGGNYGPGGAETFFSKAFGGKTAQTAGSTTAACTSGAGIAAAAGRKAAGAFRSAVESRTMEANRSVQKMAEISGKGDSMQSSFLVRGGASVTAAALAAAMTVVQMAVSFLSTILAAVASVCATFASLAALIGAVLVFLIMATSGNSHSAGYGLPPFVTEEMMEAFFEAQEDYGIPVSSGVAQLIAESGFGLYGPHGQDGQGLSRLAYDYKNLFGIKYFSGDSFASGFVDMSTGEQTAAGEGYQTVAGFSVYPDYASCIRQRAWMLMREPYVGYLSPYLNQNDGKYTREDAENFTGGIRKAGWATDISYVEKCVRYMEEYGLFRFDNMTWEQYQSKGVGTAYNGTVTPDMQRIVDVARNNQGTYPCIPDYCAAWVTGVYQAADASVVPYGDAIDMWNTYSGTGSTSMENIPPGAIVCGSGTGVMGARYGHVGIYLGDGLVANNTGHHSIESIESWCSWQTAECQGHVGWIGWVYPGGVPQ